MSDSAIGGSRYIVSVWIAVVAVLLGACASARLPPQRETAPEALDPRIVPLTVEQAREVARVP